MIAFPRCIDCWPSGACSKRCHPLGLVTTEPMRLKLRTAKGFDLQALSRALNGRAAINCARPGPLGNPFVGTVTPHRAVQLYRAQLLGTGWLVNPLGRKITVADVRRLARGRNCACFCPIESPDCHVDTILEVSNVD